MTSRRALSALLAACALTVLGSCSIPPDSPTGEFAEAWRQSYEDTSDLMGRQFLNRNEDDPYARRGGWTSQTGSTQEQASRLFLNSGASQATHVPRQGQGRNESLGSDLWRWLLDLE